MYADSKMTNYQWLKLATDFNDKRWQVKVGHVIDIDGKKHTFTTDGYCAHIIPGEGLVYKGSVRFDNSDFSIEPNESAEWLKRNDVFSRVLSMRYKTPIELNIRTADIWRVVEYANLKQPNTLPVVVSIIVRPNGDTFASVYGDDLFFLTDNMKGHPLGGRNFTVRLSPDFLKRAMRGFNDYEHIQLKMNAVDVLAPVMFGDKNGRRAIIMPSVKTRINIEPLVKMIGGYGMCSASLIGLKGAVDS